MCSSGHFCAYCQAFQFFGGCDSRGAEVHRDWTDVVYAISCNSRRNHKRYSGPHNTPSVRYDVADGRSAYHKASVLESRGSKRDAPASCHARRCNVHSGNLCAETSTAKITILL